MTSLTRSIAESVNSILEGMTGLGMDYDKGPFYQTKHFERYNEVIEKTVWPVTAVVPESVAMHCVKSRCGKNTNHDTMAIVQRKLGMTLAT